MIRCSMQQSLEHETLHLVVDAASSIGLGFVLLQWIDKLNLKKGAVIINGANFKEKAKTPTVRTLSAEIL